jgi:uncharacterized FlaG/YvyC family protein
MNNPIQPVGGGVAAKAVGRPSRIDSPDRAVEAREGAPRPEARDRQSLREVSEKIEVHGSTAEFSYDQKLDVVVVKIFSSASEPREIVRQIPPEDYLKFQARYRELLGLLFDEQA